MAPARPDLSDFPKGHEFPAITLELNAQEISQYLDAVEDSNSLYLERGLAPPLAVAARALGGLLSLMELPAATLHTGQEVVARGGVPVGVTLALAGRIAQRSERAGMIISIIEFDVRPAGGETPALTGRTTVMMPGNAGSGAGT